MIFFSHFSLKIECLTFTSFLLIASFPGFSPYLGMPPSLMICPLPSLSVPIPFDTRIINLRYSLICIFALTNQRPVHLIKNWNRPIRSQGFQPSKTSYMSHLSTETGRNLIVRLTEHRRATRNGDLNNNIAEHHLQTNHRIDWDSAECVTFTTNYYQRIVLESWFTNLEQTSLNRCLQLPAPYKRLVDDINNRQTTDWPTTTHGSKRTNHCLQQTNNRPTNFTNNTRTDIRLTKDGSKRTNHCVQSSQPMTTRLNWQSTNNITTSLTNHINDQSIYTTHWRYTNHLTLKMTSAQVVETSVNVTLNSPSQDYTHPDDRTPLSYVNYMQCTLLSAVQEIQTCALKAWIENRSPRIYLQVGVHFLKTSNFIGSS